MGLKEYIEINELEKETAGLCLLAAIDSGEIDTGGLPFLENLDIILCNLDINEKDGINEVRSKLRLALASIDSVKIKKKFSGAPSNDPHQVAQVTKSRNKLITLASLRLNKLASEVAGKPLTSSEIIRMHNEITPQQELDALDRMYADQMREVLERVLDWLDD